MSQSEEDLLVRATAGEGAALSALLNRCGPQVRAALDGGIARKWQSVLDLDDVMQVTYLEAFLRIQLFQGRDIRAFLAWLTRIAENNLRDAVKELGRAKRPPPHARIEARSAEDSRLTLLETLGASSATPSRQAGSLEACAVLRSALERLPADYAHVIQWYDLDGRPVGEVAGAIGRSEGAVYMLLARAHDYLRDVLGSASRFFSDGV